MYKNKHEFSNHKHFFMELVDKIIEFTEIKYDDLNEIYGKNNKVTYYLMMMTECFSSIYLFSKEYYDIAKNILGEKEDLNPLVLSQKLYYLIISEIIKTNHFPKNKELESILNTFFNIFILNYNTKINRILNELDTDDEIKSIDYLLNSINNMDEDQTIPDYNLFIFHSILSGKDSKELILKVFKRYEYLRKSNDVEYLKKKIEELEKENYELKSINNELILEKNDLKNTLKKLVNKINDISMI